MDEILIRRHIGVAADGSARFVELTRNELERILKRISDNEEISASLSEFIERYNNYSQI